MEELDPLTLQDWRRRVSELYAATRAEPDPRRAWERWRAERDALFERHPAPCPRVRANPSPAWRSTTTTLRRACWPTPSRRPSRRSRSWAAPGATFGARRFATARFRLGGADCSLDLYWLDGYAGGLFAPFADATSGTTTYGAGRYLLDTVKGADLGTEDGRLVLDFNFAYNPSCAYDPSWACPLAPPGNRLAIGVEAGERVG